MTLATVQRPASPATYISAIGRLYRNRSHAHARRGRKPIPSWLSWWALPAWMVPALLFTSLLSYAAWVEWCFR